MNDNIPFLRNLFPENCHGRIFLVGGSVRDLLLGQAGEDIDLLAALSADELAASGFRLVQGKSTAPIWFRHDRGAGKIEVTPLADISVMADDLALRDFTINAMAMGLDGEVIDPLDGRKDMGQRLLRACSPSSFSNDPLRIFRAFRFEAGGWRMTADTEALIRGRDWQQQLERIPVERFSREMLKALEAPNPETFFIRMVELRVGESYLPEIFRMPQVIAGPPEHHPEGDLFTHSIQALTRMARQSQVPLARFCALFHDIGKLSTNPAEYPRHHGHEEAGFTTAPEFCQRLRLPASFRTALTWTCRLHGKMNRWAELRDTTRVRTAEQALKAGITAILPLVSAADKGAAVEMTGWNEAVRVAGMSTSELGIDPELLDVMPEENRSDFILQRRVEMLRKGR